MVKDEGGQKLHDQEQERHQLVKIAKVSETIFNSTHFYISSVLISKLSIKSTGGLTGAIVAIMGWNWFSSRATF